MAFKPALPWISTLAFSQKVGFNQVLPLAANASVPVSKATDDATGNSGSGSTGSAATRSVGQQNIMANNQRFQPANITQYMQALNESFTINGTTYPQRNNSVDSSGTDNAGNTNTASTANVNTASANGNTGNNAPLPQQQQKLVATNISGLLMHGLAYVSVWTSKNGGQEILRGQLVKYGNITGASPSIAR
jgi:hypothetical protein